MALPKVSPPHAEQPAVTVEKKYDELLRKTERQTALARKMITRARRMSDRAILMRERRFQFMLP